MEAEVKEGLVQFLVSGLVKRWVVVQGTQEKKP